MSDFLKQIDQPLFPKILWEKPINKRAAKSLLIIGGHATQFSATQLAYQEAKAAGIGEVKVVLPDSVLKLTGPKGLPDCLFVASNKSGSMAKVALDEIITYSKESDGVLLAGELSENAETVSMLESFIEQIDKPLIMTDEVIKSLLFAVDKIKQCKDLLLIASTQTFIKLAERLDLQINIHAAEGLINKLELLKSLVPEIKADYVLSGPETIVNAGSKSSVTETTKAYTYGDGLFSTFWLQHPNKFEALTTGAWVINQIKSVNEIPAILNQV